VEYSCLVADPDALHFFGVLFRTEVRLWAVLDRAVVEHVGIGAGLLAVLRQIDARPAKARVLGIAKTMGVTAGAASKAVDRLERRELLGRVPDPTDRRSARLVLTYQGRQMNAIGTAVALDRLKTVTRTLSPGELAGVTAALMRLRGGLDLPPDYPDAVSTTPQQRLEFFDVLVSTEIAMWGAVDRSVTANTSINLGLLTALRQIEAHRGSARVQEVADGVGITVGAASKIVDRLERVELVHRVPNPADRRSSLLEMTDSGARALTDGMRAVRDELGRRTAVLSPEELATATSHLEALHRAFSDLDASPQR
jgi:DNA-binding MarR family transcriptional regulator